MIEPQLLEQYGAVHRQYARGEMIVQQGAEAVFYYQVLEGAVKMNNYTEDGQEIIQGIFKAGESFGEPAIFGDFPCEALHNCRPIATAVARVDSGHATDLRHSIGPHGIPVR